jgi:hypothetical protein
MVNLIPAPSHCSSGQCNWPIVWRSVLLSGVIERAKDTDIFVALPLGRPGFENGAKEHTTSDPRQLWNERATA